MTSNKASSLSDEQVAELNRFGSRISSALVRRDSPDDRSKAGPLGTKLNAKEIRDLNNFGRRLISLFEE